MSEKWLYLPVEILTRELDGKLLLAYYAVKQNYNVIIGKKRKMWRYLSSFPKGILMSKGDPKLKKELFKAKELGHAVVELDEEGLIFNEDTYLRRRMNEKYFKIVNQIYCWGNVQKDVIEKAYGHHEKIHLTGHPRFDLTKKKFRTIYNKEIQEIKRNYGDFILINTRFARYNRKKDGFDNENQEMKKLYNYFIQMIKELSQIRADLNIVVRPHQRENYNSYKDELSNFKNVSVLHSGSVIKWIIASKIVIHNGCTTGIESFLLDKPVISYMPFESEENDEYLPNAISYKATCVDEINSFIDAYLTDGEIDEAKDQNNSIQKEILSKYYAAIDENYAYEEIIRLLDQIFVENESCLESSFLQNIGTTQIWKTKKGISASKINAFFDKVNDIEKFENKKIFHQIDKDILLIKPNNN
ncbi:surface carbohydrate biosynthesis protein [Bacillus sp. V5-8f]|uniref:surface carbohydrate biosynthesis protein n=1 Tax=Bacillus sp. V5-8f TaxID=2053044 RepID=UPI0021556375|nr:surface carbohydrate biosynthesis protein [Bacillus sp. V5-8f]